MKSVHSDAPPLSRPVPEVCGNVLGNGHAVGEGSGSDGAGADAAAGTSVGMPAGTWALAVAAPWHAQTTATNVIPNPTTRSLLTVRGTIHLRKV